MNEKIKELALDAGIGFVLWDDSGRPMIDNYTPEERLAKFAELIVRECFRIVDDYAVEQVSDCENYLGESLKVSMKITGAAWKIKQHFGVEE